MSESLGPTALALAESLINHPFAWPGGYPRYAVMDDGEALCHRCVSSNKMLIAKAPDGDEWHINMVSINWEDPQLFCAHCGKRIESAYAEPEEK